MIFLLLHYKNLSWKSFEEEEGRCHFSTFIEEEKPISRHDFICPILSKN